MRTTVIGRATLLLVVAATLIAPALGSAQSFTQRQLRNLVANTRAAAPIVFGPATTTAAAAAPAAPNPLQVANDLIFHGGSILRRPSVYLIFWGSQWKAKTSISAGGHPYTPASAIRYVTDFFRGLGGSPWLGVTTQYCDHVPIGTINCKGIKGAQYVTNPTHQLRGVWVDSAAPAPSTIVTSGLGENQIARDPIAVEAEKATLHFGYHRDAVYMIMTPPGTQVTLFNFPTGYYCAYHSQATTLTRGRPVQYGNIPYVPSAGAGCRDNIVFKHDDAFGHGYYDSYSITMGHEYAEAITDPDNYVGTQDGWNDDQTSENGDKCVSTGAPNTPATPAWSLRSIRLRMSNGRMQSFAVQPTWSNKDYNSGNKDGGCSFG